MKTLLLTLGFALGGILTSFAQAQIIPLTIDSAQSSVTITFGGPSDSSSLSGTATLDLQSAGPPSGNAQITDLDLVLDDGLNFNFLIFISASSSPGDVTFSLEAPGAPGTLAGGNFNQLANLLAFEGNLSVSDPLGVAGGNQNFDLSEITFPPVDFNSVNVTQTGDVVTISSSVSVSETIDVGFGDTLLEVDVTYVASGIVPDTFLLGDVNLDGQVSFLDIAPFITLLANGGFQPEADIDLNNVISFLDIGPFINLLNGQ